ncbi:MULTISPECIES: toll/interleukin-1 receptor domain-containing protein [unclassified Kribbella]|uniref:toll/interleukin-1 receptor domain-containing protein n=1 Tax=unclassified Kribbella TaxID=2644121 RepID=UPI00301804B5
MPPEDRQSDWDLFISYASEDRNELVGPLVNLLSQFGLKTWWDQFELKVGDSLSRIIDIGLSRSRFGVVVISPSFLEKRWTDYELRGLTARELAGREVVILPVWYKVNADDILAYSPTLAEKRAVLIPSPPTDEHILDACVEILEVVKPELLTRIHRRAAYELSRRSAKKGTMRVTEAMIAPYRHDTLPDNLIGRIRLIRAALLSVYPMTMNLWIDGFKRDAQPSSEIEIWEHIAAAFLEVFQYLPLEGDEPESIFQFILLASSGVEDPPLLESLEEHREMLMHIVASMLPVVEIRSPLGDTYGEGTFEDSDSIHVEDFEDRISPEVAQRLADRLANRLDDGQK